MLKSPNYRTFTFGPIQQHKEGLYLRNKEVGNKGKAGFLPRMKGRKKLDQGKVWFPRRKFSSLESRRFPGRDQCFQEGAGNTEAS